MQRIRNFIDGKWLDPASGGWLDNVDPSSGQTYSQVADSDQHDVDAAVVAARAAVDGWSATPAAQRSEILLRLASLVERDMERLAMAECVDTGKPITLARAIDIPRAVANLRFFATAILHTHSQAHFTDDEAINYTLRRPLGVTGLISPWNLPLYLLTWKVAPALATGNTAVAKPSELTPMTAHMLAERCDEAGLPPGVLNIVHGQGAKAGAAIVAHDDVAAISFTGGTATGAQIAAAAGPHFKKLALEMGGKNPNIVFADADLDQALRTSLRSAFANQGQICLCGSRIFVEQEAYDSFVEAFVAEASLLHCGDPLEESTKQGALVSAGHLEKVRSYVELARQEGGQIRCGGAPPRTLPERCKNGFFLEPAVVTGLSPDCRTNREEIFGPVVTITPFQSEQQVIEQANATEYGLSATVWTRDLDRAHRMAEHLEVGTVWINCWLLRDLRVPFGGMKHSGVGREGGDEALRFFTEAKNVCMKLRPQ